MVVGKNSDRWGRGGGQAPQQQEREGLARRWRLRIAEEGLLWSLSSNESEEQRQKAEMERACRGIQHSEISKGLRTVLQIEGWELEDANAAGTNRGTRWQEDSDKAQGQATSQPPDYQSQHLAVEGIGVIVQREEFYAEE